LKEIHVSNLCIFCFWSGSEKKEKLNDYESIDHFQIDIYYKRTDWPLGWFSLNKEGKAFFRVLLLQKNLTFVI
jgi:hypothetical protein